MLHNSPFKPALSSKFQLLHPPPNFSRWPDLLLYRVNRSHWKEVLDFLPPNLQGPCPFPSSSKHIQISSIWKQVNNCLKVSLSNQVPSLLLCKLLKSVAYTWLSSFSHFALIFQPIPICLQYLPNTVLSSRSAMSYVTKSNRIFSEVIQIDFLVVFGTCDHSLLLKPLPWHHTLIFLLLPWLNSSLLSRLPFVQFLNVGAP